MRKVLAIVFFLLLFGLRVSSVLAGAAPPQRLCGDIVVGHWEEPQVATIWLGQSQLVKVHLELSCGKVIAAELVNSVHLSANVTYEGLQLWGSYAVVALSIKPLLVPRTPINFNVTLDVTVDDNTYQSIKQVQVPITLTSDLSQIFPNNMTLFQKVLLACAELLAIILCIILIDAIVEKRKIKKEKVPNV